MFVFVSARWAIGALIGAGLATGIGSCANLGDLVCQGDSCQDASNGSTSYAGIPGIACGGGSACDPRTRECCVAPSSSTSCTNRAACNGGTDIFCDDPRQCPGGGPCWICINAQGFQGTSCNYQADIVGQFHCDMTTALPLCRLPSQCAGGTTCKSLRVEGLDTAAAATTTWFSACQ